LELLYEPKNPGSGLALHWEPIVEVPLHDEMAIPVDVHMTRGVISLPGEEHQPATPDLGHSFMIPQKVTDGILESGRLASHQTLVAAA
jgi:hypothetical protein